MILGGSPLGSTDAQLGAIGTSIAQPVGRIVRLVGSYLPTFDFVGSYTNSIELVGMHVPIITVTGSVGDDGN